MVVWKNSVFRSWIILNKLNVGSSLWVKRWFSVHLKQTTIITGSNPRYYYYYYYSSLTCNKWLPCHDQWSVGDLPPSILLPCHRPSTSFQFGKLPGFTDSVKQSARLNIKYTQILIECQLIFFGNHLIKVN